MNLSDLNKPFPVSDIEWRIGSTNQDKTKGTALAYITNRAVMDRLDQVCGPENWKNEYKEWRGGQICGLSVRCLVGGMLEWITKWDGADDSKTEPLKGGLSDSMKRAAVQWGIGRYLYNLETSWVKLRDGKYMDSEPTLPSWALPEGSLKAVQGRTSAFVPTEPPRTPPPPEAPPVAKWSEEDVRAYTFHGVNDGKGGTKSVTVVKAIEGNKFDWLKSMATSAARSPTDREVAERAAALCKG